jgi:hypothetical protein
VYITIAATACCLIAIHARTALLIFVETGLSIILILHFVDGKDEHADPEPDNTAKCKIADLIKMVQQVSS